MVVGLVLIGVVLIGVCGVLIVSWLLWLFCDVGVWLVTWWYGYDGILDRLLKVKRVITADYRLPLVIDPDHLSKTHGLVFVFVVGRFRRSGFI